MHTHIDFGHANYVFKMLTFVRRNRQPMPNITYLFAYYLHACH